ncbi:MAG TPA: hypothetical protein VMU77_04165, partial [Acidimicrobiales bacterium]|nr:hypothetical protein [Acidimicrobiales bacterium]
MNRVTRKLDTRARRGEVARLLVVGLGNPGVEFEGTRHNVGANAVEVLAGRLGGILKSDKKTRSEYCELRVERAINIAPDQGDDGGSHKVVLAVPSTFMNDSGLAVRKLVERFSIDNPENLI